MLPAASQHTTIAASWCPPPLSSTSGFAGRSPKIPNPVITSPMLSRHHPAAAISGRRGLPALRATRTCITCLRTQSMTG